MEDNVLQPGEFKVEWESFNSREQRSIIKVHNDRVGYNNDDHMLRIFNLAKPVIVIGKKDGKTYCRVDYDSRDVLRLLIESYG